MIAYIKGKVVHRGGNYLIVETGGVGYKVFAGTDLVSKSGQVELFIYHTVREDASDLYGFESANDLDIFELLLTVSGVGPKAALNILSNLGRDKIISAITRGDTGLFKSVSGIGNKVAAKIIVELKSKIAGGDYSGAILPEEDETVEALQALGYKPQEILPYLKEIPANLTRTQDKVRYILKNVGKRV